MIRNRYKRIPRPGQDINREWNVNTKDDIKQNILESQDDSSFPVDGHQAIPN